MQTPGYIALSRQISLQRQLSITANNIANMDTVGFKRQNLLFQEHLTKVEDGQKASYVSDGGSIRDLTGGSLRSTDSPLDLAIAGDGYFTIETPGGVRYGRNGQFQLSADNRIVTPEGHNLLGEGGAPMTAPSGAAKITVSKAGDVSADDAQIGRIQLVRFENPQALVHTADGLYRADAEPEPLPSEDAVIHQGMLESSNVNSVVELVNMLDIQRDYQGMHRMLKSEHDRLTRAIREIGQIEGA
jgi:flagellar basal-body rod protein FlgF